MCSRDWETAGDPSEEFSGVGTEGVILSRGGGGNVLQEWQI